MRRTLQLPVGRVLALVALVLPLSVTAAFAQRVVNVALTWDQSREPIAGYRVHIGTRSRDYTETIDAGKQVVFVYPAISGRRYYFAVSAYTANGASSPMSSEVTTIAGSSISPVPGLSDTRPDDDSATGPSNVQPTGSRQPTCADGAGCYATRAVASNRAAISSLSVADDGSLLWVEEGRDVALLASGAGEVRMLLRAAPETRIADAVPGPHFAVDRKVTVGVMHASRDAASELAVIRYRLTDTGMSDAATVATLPAGGESAPRLTVDAADRVYVAVPQTSDRVNPYSGRILRFNADGTVPATQRAASPILAQGYQAPAMLAADARQLWAAGSHDEWVHRLSRIRLDAVADDWPPAPESIETARTMSAGVSTARLANGLSANEFPVVAYLDGEGLLHIVDRASGTDTRVDLRASAGPSSLHAVTFDAHGGVYVAARQIDGLFTILELRQPH